MPTLESVANEVHEIHVEIAALTQLVIQNRHGTTQDIQRPVILGLCMLAEVTGLNLESQLELARQLRAAITDNTTDTTMDHNGGETGNASTFGHLSCVFEAAVIQAFVTAGISEMRNRTRVGGQGGTQFIQRDSDVGALVWLNGLLLGTQMGALSQREITLYRNNIRWRMFNQDHSESWMREHLWRTAVKTILFLETQGL